MSCNVSIQTYRLTDCGMKDRLTASLSRIRSTACEYNTEGEFLANNSVDRANAKMTKRVPPMRMTDRFPVCLPALTTVFRSVKNTEIRQI